MVSKNDDVATLIAQPHAETKWPTANHYARPIHLISSRWMSDQYYPIIWFIDTRCHTSTEILYAITVSNAT